MAIADPHNDVERYVEEGRSRAMTDLVAHGVYLHGGHRWKWREPYVAVIAQCETCEKIAGFEWIRVTAPCEKTDA